MSEIRCPSPGRFSPASYDPEHCVNCEFSLSAQPAAGMPVEPGVIAEVRDEAARSALLTSNKDIVRYIDALRAYAERVGGERDEARKFGEDAARRYNELLSSDRVLRCAFCDAEYPDGTPATQHEALTAHVAVCPKHPMRAVESELSTARAATQGWVIVHENGKRWRTLDSIGMPAWTDDESKALCLRLREHADAYAGDDPEDVRIVPAT